MSLVLKNAHLVTPDAAFRGTLSIDGDTIGDLAEGGTALPGAVDLDGDLLIPGLVDLHTDNLEKHVALRPGVIWDGLGAALAHDAQVAAAGITTVFDSLALIGGRQETGRQDTLQPMVEGLRQARAAGILRAEHWLHLRCEVAAPGILDLLAPYVDDPLVRFLSVMDHTPGQRQFTDVDRWWQFHRGSLGRPDTERDTIVGERQAAQRAFAGRHRDAIVRLALDRSLPVASHDDQTAGHVEEAASLGIGIAEFPTTREAAEAARARGMAVLAGAPNLVRGGSHSGNVPVAELAANGLLDILASDYVPVSLLQAALMLGDEPFGLTLPDAIATVTRNPARAARLDDRGALAPRLAADLVQVRVVRGTPVVRTVWRRGQRVA